MPSFPRKSALKHARSAASVAAVCACFARPRLTPSRGKVTSPWRHGNDHGTIGRRSFSTATDANGEKTTEVLIVGAGPTGTALSALLSSFKVANVLIERNEFDRKRSSGHPRAHFMNRRTMEILRDERAFGKTKSDVDRMKSCLRDWRRFKYVTGIVEGLELGEVDHFSEERMERGEASASAETVVHFPQHRLMPLMWANMVEKNESNEVGFVRGEEVVNVERGGDKDDGSRSSDDASGESFCKVSLKSGKVIRSKYVVACDGASSFVAKKLNNKNSNATKNNNNKTTSSFATQTLGNIHFVSKSLAKKIKENGNEAMLYFVFNRNIVGVVVAHDLRNGEFALQLPYHAPIQDFKEMFTSENCKKFVRGAIGCKNDNTIDDIEVLDVKSWNMDANVAETVIDEHPSPRIILAGDAMHAFPPAGGFGMNTGIQDAHNLAWKLAIAVKNEPKFGENKNNFSAHSLLCSYAHERKKIASENMTLSVNNYERVLEIPRALGLEPRALDVLVSASKALPVPQALKAFAFETILGVARMQTVLLDDDKTNPLGSYRKEAVKRLCGKSGDTLKLKFLNEELGFSYASGVKAKNPNELAVGKRIPHCALENVKGQTVSTIDLGGSTSQSECQFFAVTTRSNNNDDKNHNINKFVEEARNNLPKGAALTLVRINSSVESSSNDEDKEEIYIDLHGNWDSILKSYSKQSEVVLCRPDAHVAFIGGSEGLSDALVKACNGELVI